MRKILVVVGTDSEAIRAAPLIRCLRAVPSMQTIVCIAAPNSRKLVQELASFGIHADEELGLIEPRASANMAQGVDRVIEKHKPDCVLVYGDANTAMVSFDRPASLGNPGTGLRMYELLHHTPLGTNTQAINLVAMRYFVSSEAARDNLLKAGVAPENIFVTDSTEVDAVLMLAERICNDDELKAKLANDFSFIDPNKRLILVSGRWHENHEGRLKNLFSALKRLAMRPDVQVVYPVHPDSKVNGIGCETFFYHPKISLIQPQNYLHYVYLLQTAFFILTDSDGALKEALLLCKPVLVMSEETESPEAVDAGAIKLAKTDGERILRECTMLLDDPSRYRALSTHRNPYGDGHASQRIVETLLG